MPELRIKEFSYGEVSLSESLQKTQFEQNLTFLMQLSEDSMLKPYRERAGLPAPGVEIGGWYENYAGFNYQNLDWRGFAPGHCLGQWLSALARAYAITGDEAVKEKVSRLVTSLGAAISTEFFEDFRFPAYTYDKLVGGLIDAYKWAGLSEAMSALHKTTVCAFPNLPTKPTEHDDPRPGYENDISFSWDESYTISENLFLAYERGAGSTYRKMAERLLLDERFFDPLARGESALVNKHAYSHVNALCSAVKAYLVLGTTKHLDAARNAFEFIRKTQSFATGGWGPNESFYQPGTGALGESLTSSHSSFETPCGSYAHLKLTRYLLRITGDSRYGDSMERVVYNTVSGAKPLQANMKAFYYADNNFQARKVFHKDNCPCCAGTLPQVACDYGISTYFRDEQGVYVNLYLNSQVKWEQDGAAIGLKQTSKYPLEGLIRFELQCSEERAFTLRFRIPEWLSPPGWLRVNGDLVPQALTPGKFAEVHRVWKNGDVIKLRLPLRTRLEKVDEQHPDVVALMRGPLVLFPMTWAAPKVTRRQLLEARRSATSPDEWLIETDDGTVAAKPFTSIGDEQYTTYLKVSD